MLPPSSAPSELSQAVIVDKQEARDEINTRNKFARERLRAELAQFVDKHRSRFSSVLDMDKEQLILAIQHSALQPSCSGVQYRALEIIFNLSNIPLLDNLDLHQCIRDMLQTEVVKHEMALKKLKKRLKMV